MSLCLLLCVAADLQVLVADETFEVGQPIYCEVALDELEPLDNFGYAAVGPGNFSELHARAQALEIQATLDGREYRPIGVLLYAIPRHERAVGFL